MKVRGKVQRFKIAAWNEPVPESSFEYEVMNAYAYVGETSESVTVFTYRDHPHDAPERQRAFHSFNQIFLAALTAGRDVEVSYDGGKVNLIDILSPDGLS